MSHEKQFPGSESESHERATDEAGLQPLHVCSFESRRAVEMQSLIERHGGHATVAPSMREISLDENPAAFTFAEALFAGQVDVMVFMTGVGARTLLDVLQTRYDRSRLFQAFARCSIIVRGPKPAAVLREWKLRIDHRAAEPNTWRELLALFDEQVPVTQQTVAVQEYGRPNEEFYRQLQQRGARILPVPVYRWGLPDDMRPLLAAIRSTIDGEFDVLMFTSANQLTNVLQAAESLNLSDRWIAAANLCVIASIGPTASEHLDAAGLRVDLEASPPKMGQLVRDTLHSARKIQEKKGR
jgi:uroporphyrinogen-III synthase